MTSKPSGSLGEWPGGSERLHIARTLAASGAAIASTFSQQTATRFWHKDDGSLVTEADLAVEERIRELLANLAPGEAVIGEEFGGTDRDDDYWLIDPIDGTENFRRGNPVWGVMIAWVSGGAVCAAAIDAPALGKSWWAAAGQGAYTGAGRNLRSSAVTNPADASVCFGGIHEFLAGPPVHRLVDWLGQFRTAWGWGNFWGHMQVAEGIVDGALSCGTSPWDVAAPALIVAEAGGSWSDLYGDRSLFSGSLLTGNRALHPVLLNGLKGARIEEPNGDERLASELADEPLVRS